MRVPRRRATLIGCVVAVAAVTIAGAIALVASPDSKAEPTRAQYFAQVAAICRVYGPKLDRIVPPDASGTGDVVAAIRLAFPLVKAQAQEVRSLEAPRVLRTQLARWFDLQDRRIEMLERALRAADGLDFLAVGVAYTEFTLSGPESGRLGDAIGIPHPPC